MLSFFLIQIVLTSLLVSFILLLMSKTGVRETLIDNTRGVLRKLLTCDFCMCFWLAMIVAVLLFLECYDYRVLSIPIFSTPLSRFIL